MPDDPRPSFPTALRGYATEAVDAYVDQVLDELRDAKRRVEEVEGRSEALSRDRDELAARASELSAEVDALKDAMAHTQDLRARLEELESGYRDRVRAVELLLASVAREVGEPDALAEDPEPDAAEAQPPPSEEADPGRGVYAAPPADPSGEPDGAPS